MHSQYVEQLKSHPRIGKGWSVYSTKTTSELRISVRHDKQIIQQQIIVEWFHPREQHVGGGYYSNHDKTTEWLDVPMIVENKPPTT